MNSPTTGLHFLFPRVDLKQEISCTQVDKHAAAGAKAAELSALGDILGKYKVSREDLEGETVMASTSKLGAIVKSAD